MSTKSGQAEAFLAGEGDRYFERNRAALEAPAAFGELAPLTRTLLPFSDEIGRILEIGCSNGAKLAHLCAQFGAKGFGVDPSLEAVRSGSAHFGPTLSLQVGSAAQLPFDDAAFDLVHFGFCLYLVDRVDILRVVAEADRVLRPGGFLSILDFDPGLPAKRPYSHLPGLFSYKTDHAGFFLASGHYYLVAKDSLSHSGAAFVRDRAERVSVSILHKEIESYPLG